MPPNYVPKNYKKEREAHVLWFVSWELDRASCFSKIPKYDKPLLRRIFRRGTNNNTISKTQTLFKDRSILQRSFTVGIRCFFIIHRLQCDCDCDLRLARCCAASVRSHNTTPPLRPRRGLTHLGGRHNVECRAGQEKKFFWASTCVGYRSIIVVETHTLRCSHGTPVVSASFIRRVRLCHGCGSWRKLQKKPTPGTLHGRCTRSKAVGTSNHNIP